MEIIGLILSFLGVLFAIWKIDRIIGFLKNIFKLRKGCSLIAIQEHLNFYGVKSSHRLNRDICTSKNKYIIWPVLISHQPNLVHLIYFYQLRAFEKLGFKPLILNLDIYREYSGKNSLQEKSELTDYIVKESEKKKYDILFKSVLHNYSIISQQKRHFRNKVFFENFLLASSLLNKDTPQKNGNKIIDDIYFSLCAASIKTILDKNRKSSYFILQWEGRHVYWNQLLEKKYLPNYNNRILYIPTLMNLEGNPMYVSDKNMVNINDTLDVIENKIKKCKNLYSLLQLYIYILLPRYNEIYSDNQKLPNIQELMRVLRRVYKKEVTETSPNILNYLVSNIENQSFKKAISEYLVKYIYELKSILDIEGYVSE